MKTTIIITAGGIGKRMGADIPKQFLPLRNRPILMHAIECFYQYDKHLQVLVTLPSDWWEFWQELCRKHTFFIPHVLIEGGIERYDSIKNALSRATGDIIGVHDGVRPLVSSTTLRNCFKLAHQKGSAVPVLMCEFKTVARRG